VRFFPLSQLLRKLKLARADGTYPKFLNTLAKAHLLILDDWLRSPLSEAQTTDILEIIEDRYNRRSTLLATQVPVSECHELFGNPTLAGAIRDRLIHNAYRLDLDGDPMRKKKSSLTHSGYLKV
jgi:DNA replication protein DnaC